nr:MAG TPA: hypothetical protein [Caudoviricetes sp.]
MPRTLGIILRIVRLKDIECVPVTDMGKFATVFKRNNYNEIGENHEYRNAYKDT